jgi:hypothetical protein
MAFTCHQQLHGKTNDERHQKAAVESLVKLRRDFPGTQQAQRAELLLARLSASGDSPEVAVEKLAQVPSNSPNYLAARYELCAARHQLWTKARDRAKTELAEDVLKDVDTYLAAAPQSEGNKRLRASLLAVDVLLAGKSPDWQKAAQYLTAVRSIGDRLDDKDSLAPEYHYRQLQLAQRANDDAQINRHADWLATHAAGTPYELPAMVIVARGTDERLADSPEASAAAMQLRPIHGWSPCWASRRRQFPPRRMRWSPIPSSPSTSTTPVSTHSRPGGWKRSSRRILPIATTCGVRDWPGSPPKTTPARCRIGTRWRPATNRRPTLGTKRSITSLCAWLKPIRRPTRSHGGSSSCCTRK